MCLGPSQRAHWSPFLWPFLSPASPSVTSSHTLLCCHLIGGTQGSERFTEWRISSCETRRGDAAGNSQAGLAITLGLSKQQLYLQYFHSRRESSLSESAPWKPALGLRDLGAHTRNQREVLQDTQGSNCGSRSSQLKPVLFQLGSQIRSSGAGGGREQRDFTFYCLSSPRDQTAHTALLSWSPPS